ncbi:MAG: hypothetical protein RDU13_10695 [Elusimicrobiales bacterium]|jgi:hypothetical protein|nr:hypothetical protein [Elusimicrobiales bacterium]
MSVSSHLTPDPERRLWIIHDRVQELLSVTDRKLWLFVFLSVAQIALVRFASPGGMLAYVSLIVLAPALPLGAFALSPFVERPRPVPVHESAPGKKGSAYSLLSERDLAGFSQADLTITLDKYLGGGITATPYYEDIIGQIVGGARVVVKKELLLKILCSVVLAGQLLFLASLLFRT